VLSPKLRELAIMAFGVINKADYEYAQHKPEFLAAGGT
jgi:alkylhydroperoxidase family enzyme